MTTSKRITNVFRSVFNDDNIQLDDSMTADDIEGWDSIAHVTLIFALEEEFNIHFSTSDLEKLVNVGNLREIIEIQLQ